ncbi:hypothetical protein BpHYR1_043124 [Brachionus plicatilis]|uniref:Uncharacterized protein n=1 Tax=Brachionus plicatilis TaxID=10195 RepID=A0A3M7R073_BRAPC|nr:hypothetical protein BpHYR1_043124 [Brachionus plicatilis]
MKTTRLYEKIHQLLEKFNSIQGLFTFPITGTKLTKFISEFYDSKIKLKGKNNTFVLLYSSY